MRTSRLSRTVTAALLAGVLASPAFATQYYTQNTGTTHWWTKLARSTATTVHNAAATVVPGMHRRGNGQWTATTQYPDGSTTTTTGGN